MTEKVAVRDTPGKGPLHETRKYGLEKQGRRYVNVLIIKAMHS